MVVRPVWLTSAPVRLLPIRLTVDPLATEVVAVVPATPRITVTVCAAGRVAADLDVLARSAGRVDELQDVVIHQERRVAQRRGPVVVEAETAVVSVVERARYLWVYIRKSTRSTGTYGSRVTSGLRFANQLRIATVTSLRASTPACCVPR